MGGCLRKEPGILESLNTRSPVVLRLMVTEHFFPSCFPF